MPVNIVLVGCGGMAHAHARNLKQIEDANVTALVDIEPDRAERFKNQYFFNAEVWESFEDLVKKQSVPMDAAIMVTPHTVHYPHAKLALEAGMHVLSEKPMVTSLDHGYDLWRTSKKAGKLLAVAFQSSHSAEYRWLAQARDSGELGRIEVVGGTISQGWRNGTIGKWRQDPALSGGGYVYDTGAHMLNAVTWLLNDPVVEVSSFVDNHGTPVDINAVVNMRFRNGAMGALAFGGNCPSFRSELYVVTDRALINIDTYGGKLEVAMRGRKLYPPVPFEDGIASQPQWNFVRAILGQEKLHCPARYGVLLSALMDAIYESTRQRCPVKVDPVPDDI